MSDYLVIVESPTKAKTITKFLGKNFTVLASYGHVRDLPTNASEIPLAVKKEKWSRIGVNVDNDFEALYIIPSSKKEQVKKLKDSLKNASELYLATDEDREGESISWHLLEVLKPKIPVKRMVFHEITKEAIAAAINNPRDVDDNLVRAQETRRILDRLFGYTVSPLLWKKMAPRLSAGRVQSVVLKLLVEREKERIKFKKAEYWDLKGKFFKDQEFEADLYQVGQKKLALGKDFDANTGKLIDAQSVLGLDQAGAQALKDRIEKSSPVVSDVEEKPFTQRPQPPFTTSTLQQEASYKLRLPVKTTMRIAQNLYENGFITYMRTDSTILSEEGLKAARSGIVENFGEEFLAAQTREYKTKVKNAQEAHECIRPAGTSFANPEEVRSRLGSEAFRVYDLIYKRTLACQMKDAVGTRVVVQIACDDAIFRATGKTVTFAGYLRAYTDTKESSPETSDEERLLPKLAVGQGVQLRNLDTVQHFTQPPSRFTEGSLIKELEKRGIGRPSTWASVVDLVLSRDYAFKKGTALVPTFVAFGVVNLLDTHFSNMMNYDFTARLEDDLDAISRGEADGLKYLSNFYFGNGNPGLKPTVEECEEKIDPRIVCGIAIGQSSTGVDIEVRIGKFGPFLSNGEHRASIPDGVAPDEMTIEEAERLLAHAAKGPESIGNHPETGLPIYLKSGRFGPYVQMGEMVEGGDKPKMASLLPGMKLEEITLELAVKILSLPRELGNNPENNEPIIAANGRFGPYVKCATETRSIPAGELSPISITLEQAIELLKQPRSRRGAAAKPAKLREIGKHPVSEALVSIFNGRYGPYVSDGEINASLPRGADPASVTMDEAVNLLTARAERIASGAGKGRRKKSASKSKAKSKAGSKGKAATDTTKKPEKVTKSKSKAKRKGAKRVAKQNKKAQTSEE